MARTQSDYYPRDAVYRALVERLKEDGESYSDDERYIVSYGPYATPGTAKGVASQKTSRMKRNGHNFRITIQKAVTIWEDTDE